VIRNDQTLFVSSGEIEASWEWVDNIIAGWKEMNITPVGYESGSTGPVEAIEKVPHSAPLFCGACLSQPFALLRCHCESYC